MAFSLPVLIARTLGPIQSTKSSRFPPACFRVPCSVASPSYMATAAQSVDFLTLLQNLKTSKRAGWVQKGLPECESIADHMYRMAAMSLVADEPGLDMNRCLQMAVVHDMAEAIVGDITPRDGVSKAEKCRLETAAMNCMQGKLGGDTLPGKRIRELWQEYEDASTKEAQLVKDFDKVEMILQALEYESEHDIDLGEFFESTLGKFKTHTGIAWAREVLDRRRRQQGSTKQT